MPKKRIYVLDTSVLMENADSLFSFGIHDIAIPIQVLEELDSNKSTHKEGGYQARNVIRYIDEIVKNQKKKDEHPRVRKSQGYLKFISSEKDLCGFPEEYNLKLADNRILKAAYDLKQISEQRVVFVSNDINMRIKALKLDLQTQDQKSENKSKFELYSGNSERLVPDYDIDEFYNLKEIEIEEEYEPNHCIWLRSNQDKHKAALGFYKDGKIKLASQYKKKDFKNNSNIITTANSRIRWAYPKNKEQTFAFNMLMNQDLPIVTMVGRAGTGKTLLAVCAGLYQVLEEAKYKKLMITRPVESMGKELGYLPGTLEEKMSPWINPIKDNLEYMIGDRYAVEDLLQEDIIQIEALSYIRGRSLTDSFIIIDESQNLSKHEIKTIVTRIGHGSKIVLTGDIEQIDNIKINEATNGLTYLIDKFKSSELSGHITLQKCERSKLAAEAAKIL